MFADGGLEEMFAIGMEIVLFQPNRVALLANELKFNEVEVEFKGMDTLVK